MNRIIIITGATGTLGSRIMKYHVEQGDRVFALSRCDHKIAAWKAVFPNVLWCLGDIRNDLKGVIPDKADIVYHCAAAKHVDMGETFPAHYHAVNYLGTINLVDYVECNRFVFFSTDKAVLPINFYGMTKALAEKHLLALKNCSSRDIRIFRWGNIVGSQGSVIHAFIKQLEADDKVVKVTDPKMTRFWLGVDDVVQFATHDQRIDGDILIHPKIKAAKVTDLVHAVAECLEIPRDQYRMEWTGIRPGEKIHEHLKSDHDSCIRSDTAEQYSQSELVGLVGSIVSKYKAGKNV